MRIGLDRPDPGPETRSVTWAHLKWYFATALALLLALAAWVYGKETLPVLQSKLRSKIAGAEALRASIEAERARSREKETESAAREHVLRAEKLSNKLEDVERARRRLTLASGGVTLTDEDVAIMHNARRPPLAG